MANIGIMIEGQEGLTWDRLFRIASAVEALGFESLFRSDHLAALDGFAERDALALWPSLAALALRTQRLRFGPLVCSVTFEHPALLAKMAAAVDVLSGGRLELGLGAGWYAGEHRMFGFDFPAFRTRLQRLDEAAQIITALWTGQPVSFAGQHYRLEQAQVHPVPAQRPLPLIMGGKNRRHTLPIIARHATDWNCTYVGVDRFRELSQALDEHCLAIGRDPRTLRRSLMIPFVIGRDEPGLQRRIDAQRATFPSLPATPTEWRAAGFIGGSPAEVVEQLRAFEAAGVVRFLLQHNDLDDLDSLELLASDVLPRFAGAGSSAATQPPSA
jgi:F420-dependent oxidoreductase-like protein